jgi:predicted MFS family arabinose efflux permease
MQRTCYAIRLIFLCFGLGISSWAPIIPIQKNNLGLDDAQLGLVLFVLGIGALLGMPITGWVINKLGSRIITFASGLSVLFLLPFLALAPSTLTLCFILFLFGIATGAMNVSMNAQSVDIEQACGLSILSGVHGWFSVGGLLGPILVVGLNFMLNLSLSICLVIISCLIFLLLITQWHHLLASEQKTKTKSNSNSQGLVNPHALILGVLCFIAFMAEGSILDWSAEYLRSNLHYETTIAGIGYSFFSIAMAVGRSIGDRVIEKLGPKAVFQLGTFIAASGFLVVVYLSTFWQHSELLGFILIGLGASNIVPIIFSSSGKVSGISTDTALTIVTTFGYIGLLIGPAFIGFLAQATSLSLSLAMLAFFLMAIGIFGKRAIQPEQSALPA